VARQPASFQHEMFSAGVVPSAWTNERRLGGLCAPDVELD
jgi:hypothetical protein